MDVGVYCTVLNRICCLRNISGIMHQSGDSYDENAFVGNIVVAQDHGISKSHRRQKNIHYMSEIVIFGVTCPVSFIFSFIKVPHIIKYH